MTIMTSASDPAVLGIPVASLEVAKSRLNPYFSRDFLRELVKAMLEDVVVAAQQAEVFRDIFVYSSDESIRELAEQLQILFIPEEASPASFAACLESMTSAAIQQFSPNTLVTCFSDLPLLKAVDFIDCLGIGVGPRVVVAPSSGGGCSFFLRSPPDVITVEYDDNPRPSFLSISQAARDRNVPCFVFPSMRALWDFDLIEDLVVGAEILALTKPDSPTLAVIQPELDRFDLVKGSNSRSVRVSLKN
jgi:2-phospho-L-lactate guanylyltransferase